MKLFVAILLFLPSISFSMTLGDIRNDIRYAILDTTSTSNNLRYSDSFLNYRINQVQREVAQVTYPIYDKFRITPVADQQEYTISSDTMKIDKVVFQISTSTNTYRKLIYATMNSLDNDKGIMWESLPSGLPTHFYMRQNVIGLVPAPTSQYAITNGLKVYYYKQPSDMSSDSDIPFNGMYALTNYHRILVIGTVIKCKQDKGADWTNDMQVYTSLLARMQSDVQVQNSDPKTITITK